jgi:hypothetical protein
MSAIAIPPTPVVTRRISLTPPTLGVALVRERGANAPLGGASELQLDVFETHGRPQIWRAHGLLRHRGVGRGRADRIVIEVDPISPTASELRVVPKSRHIGRWGVRRQQRYFDAAHAAADHLAHRLDARPRDDYTDSVAGVCSNM